MRDSHPALTAPLDATGKTAGEYVLGRKLGEGGAGAVYEAEHPLLQRRAAVKVLHRVPVQGSSSLLRFVAEAKAVNQIRSRHIVDVFSFGELDDGRPFYVMDLLEGEPLDAYLSRVGALSVEAALAIVRPIVIALDIAHAAGIVHRDLKPKNIFLALDGAEVVPKLLDFGVAKLMHDTGELTLSGAVLGTPLYMSPEQARGERVDVRSDVYSLGVLCYELLTGSLPFQSETLLGVAMAHITETPRAPSTRASLPETLDAPVLRMLAKAAGDRPASCGEAYRGLCEAAERAGITLPAGTDVLPPPIRGAVSGPQLATTVEASSRSRRVRALPLGQSGPGTPNVRRRTGIGVALALALAIAAYFFLYRPEPSPAPVAPPVAAPAEVTPPPTAPVAAPPFKEPSANKEPSADAEPPAKEQPAPAKPKRKRRVDDSIPRDFENPF
jgi:eukaryotic-like serine/threonine-protein kinase